MSSYVQGDFELGGSSTTGKRYTVMLDVCDPSTMLALWPHQILKMLLWEHCITALTPEGSF